MSEAPPLLGAYLDLQRGFSASSLTRAEQQVVLLTASVVNGCGYCVPVHTATARQAGVADEVVEAIRGQSTVSDSRLEALCAFTRELITNRGSVSSHTQRQFMAAGFGSQQALEVLLGVVVKTLSNSAYHLTQPSLDEELVPLAWSRPPS